jgi:hypothetical protein
MIFSSKVAELCNLTSPLSKHRENTFALDTDIRALTTSQWKWRILQKNVHVCVLQITNFKHIQTRKYYYEKQIY